MIRDIQRLQDGPFDLVVVGGGIYGAWTAHTAAVLGLKTALIERSDWASGTSSASSKLIHGGLRYLEQFRFGLVRRSLNERKVLSRIAWHRVQPLRFAIPSYRGDRVGRWRLQAGLALYDIIGGFDQPVDRHRYLSATEAGLRYPCLAGDGLEGAFTYGDFVTDDARFTLEVVDGAMANGAVAANYVAAQRLLVENGHAVGVAAEDRIGGTELLIRARVVVNSAGPWAPTVMNGGAAPGRTRLVKGVHLVMPRLPCDDAQKYHSASNARGADDARDYHGASNARGADDALLVFARRNRRVFFLIPWYGRTLLGTTDTDYAGDPADAGVDDDDVDYLLSETARVLPDAGWDDASIVGRFAGVRVLRDSTGKSPESLSREWSLESPRPGLLVSTGGKFTSARADASEIVGRVTAMLGGPNVGARRPQSQSLPWLPRGIGPEGWWASAVDDGVAAGLDRESAQAIAFRYGTRMDGVLSLVRRRGELALRIVPDLPFVQAEIVYAAATEMAVTLEDLVRRRIPLVVLTMPDPRVLTETAQLAAEVLGWPADRCTSEVNAVLEKWRPDGR
jgi:glycerol-3-phosphate dehydrogenase